MRSTTVRMRPIRSLFCGEITVGTWARSSLGQVDWLATLDAGPLDHRTAKEQPRTFASRTNDRAGEPAGSVSNFDRRLWIAGQRGIVGTVAGSSDPQSAGNHRSDRDLDV